MILNVNWYMLGNLPSCSKTAALGSNFCVCIEIILIIGGGDHSGLFKNPIKYALEEGCVWYNSDVNNTQNKST